MNINDIAMTYITTVYGNPAEESGFWTGVRAVLGNEAMNQIADIAEDYSELWYRIPTIKNGEWEKVYV